MGCLDSKPVPIQKNLLTNFVDYYKHIRKKLKAQNFKFKSPTDDISFKDRLAEASGVNTSIAKIWMTLYTDYMILAAWSLVNGNRILIYPPYPIQQVFKIHTTYTKNYLAFNELITEEKGVIAYFPIKLAAKPTTEEYNSLRDSYNWAKDFLKQNLYHNPAAHKSDNKKQQADSVWEDFEVTIMQAEFSFCFVNTEAKEHFQKVLAEHPSEVIMANQGPEEVIRVVKTLRQVLKLGDVTDHLQAEYTPKIQDAKVSEDNQGIFDKLNNLSFKAEFIAILALEQRISMEEACKWIEEYKKFLFLIYASEGKVVMSPSEAVDQVWRLHMQFTEIYYQDMMQLKPVLYCPPKRISEGTDKCEYLYLETLNVYTKYFGARDEKIWPPVERRLQYVGKFASYYLFFARGCLTEEQKKKVMLKYAEYVKKKKDKHDNDNDYMYYNSPGIGFDALILGMLIMSDPFDFNDNYGPGYDAVDGTYEGSQIFDDQSVNNYSIDNIGLAREAQNNDAGWWGGNQNEGGNNDGDDGESGGDDGGGDGGD